MENITSHSALLLLETSDFVTSRISQVLSKNCRVHVIDMPSHFKLPRVSLCNFKSLGKLVAAAARSSVFRALRFRPRLVFVNSPALVSLAWFVARAVGARCIAYFYRSDFYVRHALRHLLCRLIYRRLDKVLVDSYHAKNFMTRVGVCESRAHVLYPGVDIPPLERFEERRLTFRRQQNLHDSPVLLYIRRSGAPRELLFFVRDIFPRILGRQPAAKLIIVEDRKEIPLWDDKQELKQVRAVLENQRQLSSTWFLRGADKDTMRSVYFASDVLVLPALKTGYRNFETAAVEAAAHGLPTVAFSVDGVQEAVSEGATGHLVRVGDVDTFVQAVLSVISNSLDRQRMRRFAEKFSWHCFDKKINQYVSCSHYC